MSMAAVLRIPVMRRMFYAQIVSVFGDFLALFAVINFLTFRLNATPEQVTGMQICYLLPIAVLGVLAGVFVDRWPLKATLVTSDLTRAVLCLLLLFAGRLWHFYAILAAISVLSSFFSPAQGVAIRSAVPLHGLRSANALLQQVMFGMRIVGPGIAGVLYQTLGAHACYWADSASFVASGSLIASLAISRGLLSPPVTGAEAETEVDAAVVAEAAPAATGLRSIVPDMKQGLSFIVHHAGVLFVVLALASAMFIIGCFGPLIALYVRDSVHASTGTYSVVFAMVGVGMLGGITDVNHAGKRLSHPVLVYTGLGGIAAGLVLLAMLPFVWAAILANLLIGAAVACIMVPANTQIQQETPPALMGRVGSTVMSVIFSAQIVGLVLSGQLAGRLGVRHVFAVCAGLLVVLIAAGKLWMEPEPAVVAVDSSR